jgi:hypothetical protein
MRSETQNPHHRLLRSDVGSYSAYIGTLIWYAQKQTNETFLFIYI